LLYEVGEGSCPRAARILRLDIDERWAMSCGYWSFPEPCTQYSALNAGYRNRPRAEGGSSMLTTQRGLTAVASMLLAAIANGSGFAQEAQQPVTVNPSPRL